MSAGSEGSLKPSKDLNLLAPKFKAAIEAAIAECDTGGFNAIVFEAYRSDQLPETVTWSWESLCEACAEWEGRNVDAAELFFEYPRWPLENTNTVAEPELRAGGTWPPGGALAPALGAACCLNRSP